MKVPTEIERKIPATESLLKEFKAIPREIPTGVMKAKIKIIAMNYFFETPDLTKEIPNFKDAAYLCKVIANKINKVPLILD